jgi:hypothetical protein
LCVGDGQMLQRHRVDYMHSPHSSYCVFAEKP